MFKIRNVPAEWNEHLTALRTHGLNAIIAGGAVRDYLCGVPSNDIDILILKPVKTFSVEVVCAYAYRATLQPIPHYPQLLWTHGPGPFIKVAWRIKRNRRFRDVIRLKPKLKSLDIMLSTSNDPMEILSSFDFGICQVAWDGEKLLYTEAFRRDFMHQRFTMMQPAQAVNSRKRYTLRFAHRYPNWTLERSGAVLRDEFVKKIQARWKPKRTGTDCTGPR